MSHTRHGTPDHDRSRRALYDIVEDGELSLAEKRAAVLDLGTDYLGVSLGYVSAVDTEAGTLEVQASSDGELLPAGATVDLAETYCRRCVEDDSTLAVADAADGWADHPASAVHGLDCYLGTPLRVDGEIVGTLCFADADGRPAEFSAPERAFVELAARAFGREREITEYERELERRERELERRERELAASERKYEALVEDAPDAIFLADAGTGEIVEVNAAATEISGYDRTDLLGTPIDRLDPAGGEGGYWEEFEAAIGTEEGPKDRFEDGTPVRIERADGTAVPVEISARHVELDGRTHVQGIVRDVSDRHERERELRLKNRAIDEAPVGITIADAAGDDPLVFANERFEELTGYSWAELEGRNCRMLQGPDTEEAPVAEIRAALEDRREVRTELLNYRAGGAPFWNELSIAPVQDDRGETTHFVGFQRDVTDRKRNERLIRVLNRVLRHNLRNAMSVVLARAEQLRGRVEGGGEEAVDSIVGKAEELVAVSDQAREIAGAVRDEGAPAPTDAAALVEGVAGEVRADHPDAAVRVRAPDEQAVLGSPALRAAVAELGENAATHAGPGATVAFEVEPVEEAVAIRVRDDGPGLPPEERTVLDRGIETPLEHSSGLGLWFVNWVATGLGGRVTATVDDGGTTVTLLIPGPDGADAGRRTPLKR